MRVRKDIRACDLYLDTLGDIIDRNESFSHVPVIAVHLGHAAYWACWSALIGLSAYVVRDVLYHEFVYRGTTIVLSPEIPNGQHRLVTLNDWGTAFVPRRRAA